MLPESRQAPSQSFLEIPVKKAPHIGHQKHLCKLTESGDCSLDEIKLLVKDAKFICRVCGRVAAAGANFCNPAPL